MHFGLSKLSNLKLQVSNLDVLSMLEAIRDLSKFKSGHSDELLRMCNFGKIPPKI